MMSMKKTYIAPSAEIEMTQVQSLMALSFKVADGQDGDVADSRDDWDLWDEEDE